LAAFLEATDVERTMQKQVVEGDSTMRHQQPAPKEQPKPEPRVREDLDDNRVEEGPTARNEAPRVEPPRKDGRADKRARPQNARRRKS
jgi:hypothetical protein